MSLEFSTSVSLPCRQQGRQEKTLAGQTFQGAEHDQFRPQRGRGGEIRAKEGYWGLALDPASLFLVGIKNSLPVSAK